MEYVNVKKIIFYEKFLSISLHESACMNLAFVLIIVLKASNNCLLTLFCRFMIIHRTSSSQFGVVKEPLYVKYSFLCCILNIDASNFIFDCLVSCPFSKKLLHQVHILLSLHKILITRKFFIIFLLYCSLTL